MYYRNRGGAKRLAGQSAEAIPDLQKAVQLNSNDDSFWSELGLAWRDVGRYDLAKDAFSKAIELNSKEPLYSQQRAEAAQKLEQHPQAISDLDNALAVEETALRYVLRANSHQALGNSTAAQADFRRATELDDSYKMYDRRYLKIVNNSGQAITVHLKYYTKTTDGDWQWFPDPPGQPTVVNFDLAIGNTAYLYHDDFKINASRVRLWAESDDTEWNEYRDTDLVLAHKGGYFTSDADFETYAFSFNP
jgi:tetratricopeptide (TPR) repeat protein